MSADLSWHAVDVERNTGLALARGACSDHDAATRAAVNAGPDAAADRVISCRPHAPVMTVRLNLDLACAIDARAAGAGARICKGIIQ
ncbi:hypothetical protein [uncultured Stenotrophomonas sp.]|uniref:hypothetical protein n=1 Tax=uncultured Stenotrophomonas sp. TaxID=165438 RepID=UPI0025D2F7C9|nr:hypothetical protein [uncultured Stenotrophomonas sp.]